MNGQHAASAREKSLRPLRKLDLATDRYWTSARLSSRQNLVTHPRDGSDHGTAKNRTENRRIGTALKRRALKAIR